MGFLIFDGNPAVGLASRGERYDRIAVEKPKTKGVIFNTKKEGTTVTHRPKKVPDLLGGRPNFGRGGGLINTQRILNTPMVKRDFGEVFF